MRASGGSPYSLIKLEPRRSWTDRIYYALWPRGLSDQASTNMICAGIFVGGMVLLCVGLIMAVYIQMLLEYLILGG